MLGITGLPPGAGWPNRGLTMRSLMYLTTIAILAMAGLKVLGVL
jgi:hypothetical protein